MMVRSFLFVLIHAVTHDLQSRRTGFYICYLPFFLLRFIKHHYDQEEFDTDCSYGFLKSLNEILCSVTLEKHKAFAFMRNGLSNNIIILQEKNSVLTYDNF